MTKLPTKLVYYEALQFTVDRLTRAREGGFIGTDHAPLDPMAGHIVARRWCRFCAEAHPQGAEHVIDLAVTHGERSAHEALVELIDEKTDRNEPLGAVLGAYSIRLRSRPFVAHRGPARTTLVEDVVYSMLIVELVERFGLTPVRYQDRKHQRPSASAFSRKRRPRWDFTAAVRMHSGRFGSAPPRAFLTVTGSATAEAMAILTPHCR